MVEYILKSSIGLGIAILLYYTLLKSLKNFVFIRFFLLAALVLSLIVPTMNIRVNNMPSIIKEFRMSSSDKNQIQKDVVQNEEILLRDVDNFELTEKQKFLIIYFLIVSVFLIRFVFNLMLILLSTRNRCIKVNGLKMIVKEKRIKPYSFLNYLFISSHDLKNDASASILIQHERVHIKQFHSLDIILVELIKCTFWFNPLIWVFKRIMVLNHEYLADDGVVKSGTDREKYFNCLINSSIKKQSYQLVSGFNFTQTKNRIRMVNRKSPAIFRRWVTLLFALSLSVSFFILTSFDLGAEREPFVVVIDSGHGGKDPGAVLNGIQEKDINLSVSKLLYSLSLNNGDNIKIILTKTDDEFLELKKRVDIATENHPDFFLSIHCQDNIAKGVNDFISYYKDGVYASESFACCEDLLSESLNKESNKIISGPFYVLKHSECPSALYSIDLSVADRDVATFADPDYQTQIAKSIYNGLLKIQENRK
ncbi:N-acetylmuramoyl-L-alanine amidase [Saccharicrinis sp. FJH54]|uniref:N-acetylmuramoyl-L-alanine amidase n=1 Tax=Saccharicrinis sp. FJH54 TaxID=3344665 RepID=UPI0035D4D87F